MGTGQERYLKYWKASLKGLLGWSEEQVVDWAKQFAQDLHDMEYDFYRQDPISYIIPFLVPEEMRKTLSQRDLAIVHSRIWIAVRGDHPWTMIGEPPQDQSPPVEWWRRLREATLAGEARGEVLTDASLDHYDWAAAKKRLKRVLKDWKSSPPGDVDELARKQKEYYLNYWKVCLNKLLGWSEEQILEWARQFDEEMNDYLSMFYHDDPVDYTVPLFVPPQAPWRLSGGRFPKLKHKIHEAITRAANLEWKELPRCDEEQYRLFEAIWLAEQKGEILAPINFAYYDWAAAKERVHAVLREYGLEEGQ